jgi:glycosyltransferase involved in cell wall biosynthesis
MTTSFAAAPHVSVCLPVFNGEPYVREAIASILSQKGVDLELVVVDNASTDRTVAAVQEFDDPRLRLLRNDCNIGAGRNWSRCVAEARGDLVKILCADDWLYPGALARQTAVLDDVRNQRVVLVTAARDVVDHGGRRLLRRRWSAREECVEGRAAIRRMARRGTNLVGEPSAALFRRRAALAGGLFQTPATYAVDLEFWCRLLLAGDLYAIPESLSAFRVSGSSWSVRVASQQATDMKMFLDGLCRDRCFGVSGFDARLGGARASLNNTLRRALYQGLRLRDGLAFAGRRAAPQPQADKPL